jgi:hypothetical protein
VHNVVATGLALVVATFAASVKMVSVTLVFCGARLARLAARARAAFEC